jgi:hypothetical protein
MKSLKIISILFVILVFISCRTMNQDSQKQSLLDEFSNGAEELMNKFEPRDGVMSLLADAKTGEILALADLPETGVDRTETYIYEPGPVFDVFRNSALMFLPEDLRDSEKAMQYVLSQFGFTQAPLATARQVVEAARVFANHGMLGDVEVISPKVADITLKSMDIEKPTDMDEYAMVKHKDANAVSALAFYPAEDPQYILYVVALHPAKLK